MKTAISTILLLAMCGCATMNNMTTLERFESGARTAAYITAAIDLQDHPERLSAYWEARKGLAQLMINERFDPVEVAVYLKGVLPVKELKGDKSSIVLAGVGMLYMDQLGAMEVENPEVVRAICTGLKEGLDKALKPYEPKEE